MPTAKHFLPSSNLNPPQQTIKFEFASMTTRCVVQLVHPDEVHIQAIAQKIVGNTQRLERTYNFFSPDSWLTQTLNQRTQSIVPLDDEAWDIFSRVRKLSEQTSGVFDVSVGTLRVPPALLKANRNSRKTDTATGSDKRITTLQALYENGVTREQLSQQYQHAMGLSAWSLNASEQTIECHHLATRFDLGGVVKEYAVDAAIEIAQRAGCGALISFGGDLRVLGNKPTGDPYKVGIKNPFNPKQTVLSVPLDNEALTTSGNYERSEQVGQQTLPHLISNTKPDASTEANTTSYQADSIASTQHNAAKHAKITPASVTVISRSTLTSGVFSTALMLRPDLPLPSIAQCGGLLKVIMIDSDAKLHARSNEHLK